ncbi:acyl-CoA N-acyltransferase [Xylaria bambusicola]|uniref:acyl-CoA N-acyltransferase n=1 Tax=Xylaria bambusicola TaxID=326684 RepID=UPI002007E07C|nr:acyl-CoA N-acyltransferase [Xylaria bambusicola]KAI0521051.1 acyl-CoA N-acyltransferase [Xylaria bambusicola]
MSSENPASKIKVQTTLPRHPFPPNAARAPIRTERLIIRALTQDDLPALHALRTQPEVMACTALGRVDADVSETQAKLDPFLAPGDADTYNPGICLASTGELIGLGGVFRPTSEVLGWPEVGYMIRKEHWGKGYATEFLRAYVKDWWGLPREEGEVVVDGDSLLKDVVGEGGRVREMLGAIVEEGNIGSTRVMEKSGFKKFKAWTVKSRRAGHEGEDVTLVGFVNAGPEESA